MNATTAQIRDVLASRQGPTFVTISSETNINKDLAGGKKCPLRIKGDRIVDVTKRAIVNGMINWNYENSVNNQRVRENQPVNDAGDVQDFKAEARQWGQRLHLTEQRNRLSAFVHHVEGTKRGSVPSHKSVTTDTILALPVEELYLELKVQKSIEYRYYVDGVETPRAEIEKYMREKEEGPRQQVDKPVILRDYKLVNILQLTLDNETYTVRS